MFNTERTMAMLKPDAENDERERTVYTAISTMTLTKTG
jgi:hypothetical protein